ncbi:MAG: ThuA domain-containing protein [Planctomycetaceae bacterium]|nr:ThuA domain-containing protein [Planctomycetaceae bacterium]
MRYGTLFFTFLTCFLVFTTTAVAADTNTADAKVKVLIIDDESKDFYRFAGTAPLLMQSLNKTPSITAEIVEYAEVLATDKIFVYDVLMLHFKNYKPLKGQEQAQKNLIKFVQDGGGLFIYHFACGAFEDWAEFEKLIGRIWFKEQPAREYNGKKYGYHDPYGKFTVRYTNKEHPITKGLADFETQDELYFCFKPSEVPITVLAEATSIIDNKSYPMSLVLEYGKGRVFNTTLGHDAASISSDGFVKQLVNAVLWLGKK